MTDSSLAIFASIVGGLTVFTLLYAIFMPVRSVKRVTISDEVFGDGHSEVEGSGRYARPLIEAFAPALPERVASQKTIKKYAELLRVSGNPWKLNPEELVVLQLAGALIGVVIGIGVAAFSTIESVPPIIFPLIFGVLGFILPYGHHTSLRDTRAHDVQTNLPEALDLLQVVIATNSTIPSAIQKVTKQLSPSFLRDEFHRMHIEMKANAPLEEALTSFARTNTAEEASAFATAIIQGNKLGADPSDTLKRQAALARANHEARIERMIARLQTMLFVPLAGFMVPAFLVIFLAPTLASIGEMMG